MEFCEKLRELRKSRGITQDQLAEALYVSRTAVSKWEQGRGLPNIDSIKEISVYFSVSIDDLLSADKLIFIAEKENKQNMQDICNLLIGMADIFAVMLVLLPLYPCIKGDFVYSVNLFNYTDVSAINKILYWVIYLLIITNGIIKTAAVKLKKNKWQKIITEISMGLSAVAVIVLSVTRQAYAVVLVFIMLVLKTVMIFRYMR